MSYGHIEDDALRAERDQDWLAAARMWLDAATLAQSREVRRRCLELGRAAFLRVPIIPSDREQQELDEAYDEHSRINARLAEVYEQ